MEITYKKNPRLYFRLKQKEYYDRRQSDPKKREQYNSYHREYRLKNREKILARRAVFIAVRNGTLKKKPCEAEGCEKVKVHAHHSDYKKPLFIKWFCPIHHAEADGKVIHS